MGRITQQVDRSVALFLSMVQQINRAARTIMDVTGVTTVSSDPFSSYTGTHTYAHPGSVTPGLPLEAANVLTNLSREEKDALMDSPIQQFY